ncbi:transcription-repair coupling factor [Anoxybacter fermentans]|uniref:transcription-repair coupling factor n=1 Tax=Anoxybacter fermentans TaxID=1323375 RepID=UPI001F00E41D|nr:transcription-repair coupling factor [Anoxybacter fermentans]
MSGLTKILHQNEKYQIVKDALLSGQRVSLFGLANSQRRFFLANLYQHLDRHLLVITHDLQEATAIYEDLTRLLSEEQVLLFPELEVLPHERLVNDLSLRVQRLKVLEEILFNPNDKVVVTTVQALMRRGISLRYFKECSIEIRWGLELNLDEMAERLVRMGYERVGMVEGRGQFSIRGGIIDIFPMTRVNPIRIDLFGDEVDTLKEFDLITQRSIKNLDQVVITPADEIIFDKKTCQEAVQRIRKDAEKLLESLKNVGKKEEYNSLRHKISEDTERLSQGIRFEGIEQYLPYFNIKLGNILEIFSQHLVVIDSPERTQSRAEHYIKEIHETEKTLMEQGIILPLYNELFSDFSQILWQLEDTPLLMMDYRSYTLDWMKPELVSNFFAKDVEPFHGKVDLLTQALKEWRKKKYRILLTLSTDSKCKRLVEHLKEEDLSPIYVSEVKEELKVGNVVVTTGDLSKGFVFEELKLVVYTEMEILGRQKKKKRKIKEFNEGVRVTSFEELEIGDYVVHENHGIGKYLGVKTLEIQGNHQDYLVIKYAGEDKLYVPTNQVDLIQKYIGVENQPPKLYKLGGNEWNRVKKKVKESVRDIAMNLLKLYAEREMIKGYAFSKDTPWQKEFEDAFPYEETPDQLKAIEEVKQDMEEPKPMDRLLCGDVGYGKTEVAIRAAFKAVQDSKQVAVLVPTTVLAQQHYSTFTERFKDFPVNIEVISRFRTQAEQKKILDALARGEVDIIIGTHRLLSKDVVFHDLGLVIVDEEQRFGVTHKERLKELKKNVDVLTLTATPIPRTLHMALVGVRDMSVIETPPEDRYPIRTYVREYNEELIRDAITRELSRGGQVYFVHNRVEDIDEIAGKIMRLVPDARVAVAHGQMNEHRLEKLMVNFLQGNYDVLVCTTIIETGLDIPNVNTIIINDADKMGLSQLYQLRGRVGRSNRIAYAYLLYRRGKVLSEVAEKRLRAIKEFTNLGSGFKIAMRDLEIRGAGNILGPEQHGHIASIGFSLYCKLLEESIRELQGKIKEEEVLPAIELNLDAYIPEDYIPDSRQKIEIYKKIAIIKSQDDIDELVDELIDRFGDIPQPVKNLIQIAWLKCIAGKLNIEEIKSKNGEINIQFRNADNLDGNRIIELTKIYRRKLKIRNGVKPVIVVQRSDLDDAEVLKLLREIITYLQG